MATARMKLIKGIAASPGIAVGSAHLVDRRRFRIPKRHLEKEDVDGEVARFLQAVQRAVGQLVAIKEKMAQASKREPLAIIDAQILMVQDEMLLRGTEDNIRRKHRNAEWALREAVSQIRREFDRLEDDYFRERRSDVEFVGQRLMHNLMGRDTDFQPPPGGRVVLVAHELSPVDTAGLDRSRVIGFVTEAGGKTSHTAIIARSLGLPAVVGAEDLLARVGQGDRLVVDGYRGRVTLHPSERAIQEALERKEFLQGRTRALMGEKEALAQTRDGHRLNLLANLEMVEEVGQALHYGAEGIGLFRTEFLFLQRRPPTEGFQRRCYREILRRMKGRPVTIRTLDLGGDKRLPFLRSEPESNPALGLRSIRLMLRNRPLFLTQLRALLRASVEGKLKILFPMISCMQELRAAREALEEAKEQLRAKGQAFDEDVQVGIMVEVPSAAVMSDVMAKHVDFFSIGTNDLVQYMLAADRQNEQVADLFDPLHVAVLRTLQYVVRSAHQAGIPVTLCGEMAGDPLYLHVVLGLELDEISMNPMSLPYARHMIRQSRFTEARRLIREMVKLGDSEQIREKVRQWMAKRFPDFFTREGPAEILGGL